MDGIDKAISKIMSPLCKLFGHRWAEFTKEEIEYWGKKSETHVCMRCGKVK